MTRFTVGEFGVSLHPDHGVGSAEVHGHTPRQRMPNGQPITTREPPLAKMYKFVSIAACAAALASGAHAASFQNDTGLAAPTAVETFDGSTLAEGTVAGTLFSGLTFSSNLVVTTFLDGWMPNVTGQSLANFNPFTGDCSACQPFNDVRFGAAVTGAAFSVVSFPGTIDFSAYLGNTLVETASFATGFNGQYVGFTGISFDRIVFGSATSGPVLAIDNLQTAAAVPEPETTAMMLLGLIGMAAVIRRRSTRG